MNRVRQFIYIVGLLLWYIQAQADEQQTEQPSMDLLEFLGSAERVDGEWLDPLNMLELMIDKQQTSQQEGHEND